MKFTTRSIRTILMIALAPGLLPACGREERIFRPAPIGAEAAPRFMPASQHAGPPEPSAPTGQAAGRPHRPVPSSADHRAYAVAEGRRLFNAFNCVGCHANGGGGMGPALMDDVWIYGPEPEQIYWGLVEGHPNGMPAFGERLTDDQIWRLAAYVRSMSGLLDSNTAPGRADHMMGAPPPASAQPDSPKPEGPK